MDLGYAQFLGDTKDSLHPNSFRVLPFSYILQKRVKI